MAFDSTEDQEKDSLTTKTNIRTLAWVLDSPEFFGVFSGAPLSRNFRNVLGELLLNSFFVTVLPCFQFSIAKLELSWAIFYKLSQIHVNCEILVKNFYKLSHFPKFIHIPKSTFVEKFFQRVSKFQETFHSPLITEWTLWLSGKIREVSEESSTWKV